MTGDRWTVAFVHLVAAALTFAAGWYVLTQGSSLPVMDEWDLLASWTEAASTGEWALQHHCEHRFPLPKLLWLAALRATGYDFRAVMFGTLALLTSASVLLMWTARGLRGRQHPLDALFPALLLHWGHGFNLIMSFQLGFALVAYALAGWLWCARRARGGRNGWLLAAVAYSLLIVPCGGFGVTFAPAVAGWCGWVGWREWRAGRGRRAPAPLLAAALTTAYTGWVLKTMPLGLLPTFDPLAEPFGFVGAAVGYLSVAVGTWPADSDAARWAVGVAVVALYAVALVRGARRFRERPTPILAALLAVMVGSLLTAAAAAYARGAGYTERMADASAVGLIAAWLTAAGGWRGCPKLSAALALLLAGGLFAANWTGGLNWAISLRNTTFALRADLRGGAWPSLLASRYGHSTAVLVGTRMMFQIPMFRALGVPDFRDVPDDPPALAVPVPGLVLPLRVGYPTDVPLDLPAPPPNTFALRFLCRTPAVIMRERVTLLWTDANTGTRHEAEARPVPTVADSHLIYPIHGRPTDIRLRPNEGVSEVLLIAAEWLVHTEKGK